MNELGIALIWSAVQVTLLGLLAVLLHPALSRRDPRVGVLLTVGCLGFSIALTLAAFTPLPGWWNLESGEDRATSGAPRTHGHDVSLPDGVIGTEGAAAGGLNLAQLATWLRGLGRVGTARPETDPAPRARVAAAVSVTFVTGAALSLLRFFLGLWSVRTWRQRSRPIDDGSLQELLAGLAEEIGCRRVPEVRECAQLLGPATVGWRRPLLLLPADWRTWTDAELRAVLAHELAHVVGGDYLSWLVARLSVALHFYHPLVYWLARRLHLQQELAADALGARCAGGRGVYLHALARLALRQDEQPTLGPARAFLPARGTLMRRIAMLRSKEAKRNPWLAWVRRIVAFTLLVGAALAVSAVRGPAIQAEPPKESAKPVSGEQHEPFDLSYLDENALGVMLFRPAAVFADPKMKQVAAQADLMLAEILKVVGFRPELGLKVEAIEQVSGTWVHTVRADAPKGQRNTLITNLTTVRTVKPFDWKKAIVAVACQDGKELEEVHYGGKTICKIVNTKKAGAPGFSYYTFSFYVPDDRTLVIDSEARLRKVIDRAKTDAPKFPWADSLRQVDRGWFAVAIHTADQEFRRAFVEAGAANDDVTVVRPYVTNARSIAFSLEGIDHVVCHATAACESDEKAKVVATSAQVSFVLARNTLDVLGQQKDLPHPQGAGVQLAKELLKTTEVGIRRAGETAFVDVRCSAKVDLAKFFADFVKAEMGVEEEKK